MFANPARGRARQGGEATAGAGGGITVETIFVLWVFVVTLWGLRKVDRALVRAVGDSPVGYHLSSLLLAVAVGVLGLLLAGAGWVVWALFGLGETAKAYLVGLPGALGIMVLMFLVPIFSLVFVVVLFVGDR